MDNGVVQHELGDLRLTRLDSERPPARPDDEELSQAGVTQQQPHALAYGTQCGQPRRFVWDLLFELLAPGGAVLLRGQRLKRGDGAFAGDTPQAQGEAGAVDDEALAVEVLVLLPDVGLRRPA